MKKVTSSTNGLRSHRKLLLAKRSEILSGSRSKRLPNWPPDGVPKENLI
jgi:hypothetical protein